MANQVGREHVLGCDEAHCHHAPQCCSPCCWCTTKGVHPAMNREQLQDFIVARKGDMTQKDFAAKLGITPQFLNDILQGKRNPGPQTLKALKVKEIVLYEVIR